MIIRVHRRTGDIHSAPACPRSKYHTRPRSGLREAHLPDLPPLPLAPALRGAPAHLELAEHVDAPRLDEAELREERDARRVLHADPRDQAGARDAREAWCARVGGRGCGGGGRVGEEELEDGVCEAASAVGGLCIWRFVGIPYSSCEKR